MKRFIILLLLIALPVFAAQVELIPGLISYDIPDFFYRITSSGGHSDNPFSGRSQSIEFGEICNGPRHLRQLNVSIRAVGFSIGEGKRVSTTPLSFDELRMEMERTFNRGSVANSSKAEVTIFAGRKALHLKKIVPLPGGAVRVSFYKDTIWVPLDPNRVLELDPTATSEELLQTILDSFKSMKILVK